MTKQEQQDLKKVIKEAVLEVLKSTEGQEAIVDALRSKSGQQVLVKSFVAGYNEMVEPMLEDIWHDIKTIKIELKYMKDQYGTKIERLERKVGLTVL
ncbi:hypothetical protein HYT74_02490 [Candidatus Daviesbacteria bacterium]|nr:hypothetical protein [Candidatus Daviesbacteria bacterium]